MGYWGESKRSPFQSVKSYIQIQTIKTCTHHLVVFFLCRRKYFVSHIVAAVSQVDFHRRYVIIKLALDTKLVFIPHKIKFHLKFLSYVEKKYVVSSVFCFGFGSLFNSYWCWVISVRCASKASIITANEDWDDLPTSHISHRHLVPPADTWRPQHGLDLGQSMDMLTITICHAKPKGSNCLLRM